MKLLALEISTRQGSLALAEFDADAPFGAPVEIVSTVDLPADRKSARAVAPVLADLLAAANWQASDLDLIATTFGPGSFTGLRIAVTTAKTLAYAVGAKVVGVNTLEVIALQSSLCGERVWSVMNAQRDELFAMLIETNASDLNPSDGLPPVKVIAADDWLKEVRPGDIATGPGLSLVTGRVPDGVDVIEESHWRPTAEMVARLAAVKFAEGKATESFDLLPNYYRLSAAEEKLLS